MDEIMSLEVLFDEFIEHNKVTFQIKQEDHNKELKEYQKLKLHIQHACSPLKLKSLLETYVTQYRVYKESDLLLGNEQVIVSTVHKAKGLEFDNVIVAECIGDNYPFFNSRTEDEIREDARTLYVAITRAKRRLCITSHTFYYTPNGDRYNKSRSPFLHGIASRFECYPVKRVSNN
ncbi:3'-5' exonuclease [Niastella populi]|nr:3'-5' exonuclease [Niastella populi]